VLHRLGVVVGLMAALPLPLRQHTPHPLLVLVIYRQAANLPSMLEALGGTRHLLVGN
jgi:hypothetical protein